MNVCRRKRKEIALLVLNAIGGERARQLRAHVESCSGCRQYLAEISRVSERICRTETESGLAASPAFHRRFIVALRMEEGRRGSFATTVQTLMFNWRAGLAVGLLVLLTAAALFVRFRGHQIRSPLPAGTAALAAGGPGVPANLEPTISNYSALANRSLDQFDELLTQQANKPLARYPVPAARDLSDVLTD